MKYLLIIIAACLTLAAPASAMAPKPNPTPAVPIADLNALKVRETCALNRWHVTWDTKEQTDAAREVINSVTVPVYQAVQAQYAGSARAFADARARAELGLLAFPGC